MKKGRIVTAPFWGPYGFCKRLLIVVSTYASASGLKKKNEACGQEWVNRRCPKGFSGLVACIARKNIFVHLHIETCCVAGQPEVQQLPMHDLKCRRRPVSPRTPHNNAKQHAAVKKTKSASMSPLFRTSGPFGVQSASSGIFSMISVHFGRLPHRIKRGEAACPWNVVIPPVAARR